MTMRTRSRTVGSGRRVHCHAGSRGHERRLQMNFIPPPRGKHCIPSVVRMLDMPRSLLSSTCSIGNHGIFINSICRRSNRPMLHKRRYQVSEPRRITALRSRVLSPGALFAQWSRLPESSPLHEHVPELGAAAMAAKAARLARWRHHLEAISREDGRATAQVDYRLVKTEMNGLVSTYGFEAGGARSPAFYVSFGCAPTCPCAKDPFVLSEIDLRLSIPRYRRTRSVANLRRGSGHSQRFIAQPDRISRTQPRDLWYLARRSCAIIPPRSMRSPRARSP